VSSPADDALILNPVSVSSLIIGAPTLGLSASLNTFTVNGADDNPALSHAVISIFHLPSVSIGIGFLISIIVFCSLNSVSLSK